jgi:bifunctional ADP-heptose synthase (sugar kinase/adenylyltransferase)
MKNDILVIGDSCRDVYVYCEANRLAPDVPVPVLNVLYQNENGGMASNVFRNIQPKIPGIKLITNDNWHSVTKTRYVHTGTNHTFFRVDSDQKIKRINLSSINFDYKIIVISDYNKGFLLEEDIEYICEKHPNVFIDSKKILGPWVSGAKYIKINNHEYRRSKDFITKDLENKIICTTGENGCNFRGKNYPVKKVEVIDVSGAGDSFMAGLVIEYLRSEDIVKSIKFANECSSEVVQHPGVTIINF